MTGSGEYECEAKESHLVDRTLAAKYSNWAHIPQNTTEGSNSSERTSQTRGRERILLQRHATGVEPRQRRRLLSTIMPNPPKPTESQFARRHPKSYLGL